MVSTYAGGGNAAGVSSVGALVDAQDTAARFYTPAGLAIDKNGNLFVADAYNHRIRLVDTSRYVTTLAGSGQTGPGNGGYMNGPLNMSVFNTPTELFIDTAGNNLYISDTFNNRIRLADLSAASVSTLAGNGNTGFADGIDTMASFNFPRGIVVATTAISKFYVADYNNHSIRLISPDSTSSVSEIEFTALIYPNPTHGFITLSAEKLIRRISIYNINGRVVLSPQIYFYNTTIDLSALSKGVYWLEATDETDKKIIKRFLLF
jgi:DNA-binding beta-propeller fold protein YncE